MEDRKEIQKLAGRLFSEEQAREFAENLRDTDKLFDENLVLEPGSEFTDRLKAEVNDRVKRKKAKRIHRTVLRIVSAAAVLLAAAVIITNFSSPEQQVPINNTKESSVNLLSDKIWQSSDLAKDDPELSSLNFELKQLQRKLTADRSDESPGENAYRKEASEIEASLLAINNEFWKGR